MILAAECASHCSFLKSYLGLMTDLPHICLEITLTIVQDVIIGLLLWPILKGILDRRGRKIHEELDIEHGIEHKNINE